MINFLNSLKGKKIGRKLLAGLIIAPIITTGFKTQPVKIQYKPYTVQTGDTVWSISCNIKHNNKINKDVRQIQDDIIEHNNIKGSIICNNQIIEIPRY